ncbi:MAG: iron ABC transporter permease [Spirochaetaceae bacterium]|nr:iron ABC transporter permease [Spirochaetaceae bacterium]
MKRSRFVISLIILLSIALGVTIFSVGAGAVYISPSRVFQVLSGSVSQGTEYVIIMNLRLPRVILAAFIGGGLAVAGTAFQGMFRNPLADPYVVGASGGAALGATMAIAFGLSINIAGFNAVPITAFFGSIAAVFLVYLIAESGNSASTISLLLAGTALSTILSSVVSLIMLLSDKTLHETYTWLLGGLSGRSWNDLTSTAPFIILGSLALWFMSRPLDALASGEKTAISLGLPVKKTRALIVLMASLTTAAAVAAGGIIGFVGLVAPHIARLFFGSSHRRLIPASMITGAILLILADVISRTIVAPMELPAGIITSITGGIFFLYLLKARSGELRG